MDIFYINSLSKYIEQTAYKLLEEWNNISGAHFRTYV